jgi:hypothetical protein
MTQKRLEQDWLDVRAEAFGWGFQLVLNARDIMRNGRTLFFLALVRRGRVERRWCLSWLRDYVGPNRCLEWRKGHSKDGCVMDCSGWRLRGPLERIS